MDGEVVSTLVPIPWQPHLFVAPSFLARLERASDLAGHKIYLNSIKSPTGRFLAAWRALEEAIYLYDLFLHHGGEIASNPWWGNRVHLRGAGGDIRDRADRKYMLAAGFLPDAIEWWHFNDPNWRNMPIIAINVQTAGHGTIPPDPVLETIMFIPFTLIFDPQGTGYVVSTDGISQPLTAANAASCRKVLDALKANDEANDGKGDDALTRVESNVLAEVSGILRAIK